MVLARLIANSGYQVAEVMPVALGLVFAVTQVPSNLFPRYLVDVAYRTKDERGEEVQLTYKMKRFFDRELCESGLENKSIVDVQTFATRSGDVMSKGFFAGRFDCIIGLPLYFNYENRSDVDADDHDLARDLKRPLFFRRSWRRLTGLGNGVEGDGSESNDDNDDDARESDATPLLLSSSSSSKAAAGAIDWDSPAGVAYKDSLVLSPMAKRFAAARIIHETDRCHLIYAFATGYVGIEVAHAIYRWSIKELSPVERRMKQRLYSLTAMALGAVIWFSAVRIRNSYYERSADVATANIGPDYAAGGVEYYEKMLARHRALRHLLAKRGERRFQPNGNVRNSFGNWIEDFNVPIYHRSITDRLRSVKKIASDLDAMSYEELEHHLQTKRFHRMPRKTAMPMTGKDWRTKEAREWEEQSGMLEFEKRQLEARKKK